MYLSGSLTLGLLYMMFLTSYVVSFSGNTSNRSYHDPLSFLLLFLTIISIVLSRNGLGVDEPSYLMGYQSILIGDTTKGYSDIAFNGLNHFFSEAGVRLNIYNNTVPLLYIITIAGLIFCNVNKNYRSLVFVSLVFSGTNLDFMFNAYRQAYAFLFFFAAIIIRKENSSFSNKLLVFGLYVVSFLFHWSAIVPIIIFMTSTILSSKLVNRIYILVIAFANISLFYNFEILSIIKDALSLISLDNERLVRILAYTSDSALTGKLYGLNYAGRIFLILPIMATSILVCLSIKEGIDSVLTKYAVIYLFCCTLLIDMSFSFRNYYWLFPFISLIACEIVAKNHKRKNLIYLIIFIYTSSTFFSSSLMYYLFR